MPRVLISAGHTNQDPGTVVEGIREVDLTRRIAQATTKALRGSNIITLAVPPDLDLANRIQWINQTGYSESTNDVCVEIHINDGGKRGIEGWYKQDNAKSQKLTETIVSKVVSDLKWTDQGSHSEKDHPYGTLAFLSNTKPIPTLIECGYLDNEQDREFLKDQSNIEKLANAIAEGIRSYMDMSNDKLSTNTGQQSAVNDLSTSTNLPQYNTPTLPNRPASSGFDTSQYNYPSSGGINSTGYGFPRMSSPGLGGSAYMSREERRDMIHNNYIKILGREPSQSDLNYFLNIGITEEQLIKKMIDSQEHADLVKSRQEIIKTKEQFVNQKSELLSLRAKVDDQKRIIKNLNLLLTQKNKVIQDIQQKLQSKNSEIEDSPETREISKPVKTLKERILDYFSERFS